MKKVFIVGILVGLSAAFAFTAYIEISLPRPEVIIYVTPTPTRMRPSNIVPAPTRFIETYDI